ncbi:hypothetical protein Lal_00018855 [Lupinus albus]|nr:hypothetical protein Lal_00018855 [Lupinus albus]
MKHRYYDMKMEEATDLRQHLNTFNQVINGLQKLDDEGIIIILLIKACAIVDIREIGIVMNDSFVKTLCEVRPNDSNIELIRTIILSRHAKR